MASIAASTERAQRIQSIPAVRATPKNPATHVPTKAPTAPKIMVQIIEIFCLPGINTRANAPIIAPVIIDQIMVPTVPPHGVRRREPEDVPQTRC